MNISQLKDLIQDLPDEVEVRLMTQSNYPFEYSVQGGVTLDDIIDFQVDENKKDEEHSIELFEPASGADPGYFGRGVYAGSGILYLVEGTQLGYGTSDAWGAEEESYGR